MDRRTVKALDVLLFAALIWGASQARGAGSESTRGTPASSRSELRGLNPTIAQKIEGLLGKGPSVKGPNCWNLALVSAGLLNHIRHTDSEEFKYFMSSSACRMLKDHESRGTGDIGAIRLVSTAGYVEYHGFTFLSGGKVLTKNGVRPIDHFQIQTLDEVLSQYKVPPEDQCRTNDLNLNSGCVYQLSVYRCSNAKSWQAKSPLPLWASKLRKHILRIEKEIENRLLSGANARAPLTQELKNEILKGLAELERNVADLRSAGEIELGHQLALRWAQTTLASLHEQLSSLNEGSLAASMANTEARLWDFLQDLEEQAAAEEP